MGRALLVQSRFPIVLVSKLECGSHSVATLDTDDNEDDEHRLPHLPIFVLGK